MTNSYDTLKLSTWNSEADISAVSMFFPPRSLVVTYFLIGFLYCGIFLAFLFIEGEALMGLQLYAGPQSFLMQNQTFSTVSV